MDITKIFINMLAQKAINLHGEENIFDVNYIVNTCQEDFDFKFCLIYEFVLKFSKSAKFSKMDEIAQKEVIDWIKANKVEYNNQMQDYKEKYYIYD